MVFGALWWYLQTVDKKLKQAESRLDQMEADKK